MRLPPSIPCLLWNCFPLFLIALFFCFSSCNGKKGPAAPPPAAPRLESNNIQENPSPLLQSLAQSTVQWKQYTPTTVHFARDAKKLILVFACSNLSTATREVMETIHSDPTIVKAINQHFVPVIIDAEACRETGIFAAILSSEIKRPVSFPFMMWMTAEGNPIAWLPLTPNDRERTLAQINHSQSVVINMTTESIDYLHANSRLDNEARKKRITPKPASATLPTERTETLLTALRTLHNLCDPATSLIEGTGTLVPIYYLDLMCASAQSPHIPPATRTKSREILLALINYLLQSAAIDFLDGGIYHNRADQAWAMTTADRNALTQAEFICTLANTHAISHDPAHLQAALRTMAFLESQFALPDGTFRSTRPSAHIPNEVRHWTLEDIQSTLDAAEFRLISAYCALSSIGNVPMESDPRREMFRRNSLTPRIPFREAAAACSLTPDDAEKLLASAKAKLLTKRQPLLAPDPTTFTPDLSATHSAAAAYAALFRLTGEAKWKDQAVRTLQALRTVFHSGQNLSFYPPNAYPSTTDARAGHIASTIKSVLDVHHITGDAAWLDYAQSLTKYLEQHFLVDGFIEESPPSCRLISTPAYNTSMIFDASTSGTMAQNLTRMERHGIPRNEVLKKACAIAIDYQSTAVTHTDYLLDLIYQEFAITLVAPRAISPEMTEAIRRIAPGTIHTTPAPADATLIMAQLPDQPATPIHTPQDLHSLLSN